MRQCFFRDHVVILHSLLKGDIFKEDSTLSGCPVLFYNWSCFLDHTCHLLRPGTHKEWVELLDLRLYPLLLPLRFRLHCYLLQDAFRFPTSTEDFFRVWRKIPRFRRFPVQASQPDTLLCWYIGHGQLIGLPCFTVLSDPFEHITQELV